MDILKQWDLRRLAQRQAQPAVRMAAVCGAAVCGATVCGATVCGAALIALSVPENAYADAPQRWNGSQDGRSEPRSTNEPRLMREPGEVTNVLDAFDPDNPFDVGITLGYGFHSKRARIVRESSSTAAELSSGGFTARTLPVANYAETTHRLIPRLEIGAYRDLSLFVAVPLILSHSRSLTAASKIDRGAALVGGEGERLFSLPFEAPKRSGLEHIAVGLRGNPFNQFRDPTKPTWLIEVEADFSVGRPMRACNPDSPKGQVDCADAGDINRNGRHDSDEEAKRVPKHSPGVTRGTFALQIRSFVSKRYRFFEPYMGVAALAEFAAPGSEFARADVEGTVVRRPPLVGTFTTGIMFIPWENRERFGRLTIDARVSSEYHSEGRDYSELFDALGSSSAPTLRNPQYSRYKAGPSGGARSVIDKGSERAYFTGLADVQAFGGAKGHLSVLWQAGQYVKFTLGGAFGFEQAHGITGDQPCNPNQDRTLAKSGPCVRSSGGSTVSSGAPNPNYRHVINAPSRRFAVEGATLFDLYANAVVMF